ncbi:MAG: metallophosphoesterase [Oscillospiraceae bacterium]|nr:metallophosphoesterase [Oscillospiraceae bacterium]
MGILNSDKINERFKKKMASLTVIAPPKDDPISLTDPDNIRFSAAIWSDLHFSAIYEHNRTQSCRISLEDLSASQVQLDALLIAGDLCENGKMAEKEYLAEQLQSIKTVKTVLPASGNHDVRLRHIENSIKKFSAFCNKVNSDLLPDKMYYSREVNGYKIIILGTTRSAFEESHLDDEEMEWLKNELRSGTANGKPVFVIAHQPLQFTHNLPNSWDTPGNKRKGSIGKQSEHLKNILNGYKNVFFITGHLHRGFNINTYEEIMNFHSVNAPSTGVWNKDSVYSGAGLGFILEVYDSFVLFRPRDFMSGKFIPEYNKKYSIL